MRKQRDPIQLAPYAPRPASMRRKQEILDFIKNYRSDNGISPTYNTIAEALYGREEDAHLVRRFVLQLIDEGFLVQAAKGARALLLTVPQPRAQYYVEEDKHELQDS